MKNIAIFVANKDGEILQKHIVQEINKDKLIKRFIDDGYLIYIENNINAYYTHIINNKPEVIKKENKISLEEAKKIKREEVSQWFEKESYNGMLKTSLGITIDARKNGNKNDIQNLEELLKLLQTVLIPDGINTITLIDAYDNEHDNINENELKTIIKELRIYSADMFNKKRKIINKINKAKNLKELDFSIYNI